MALIKPTEEELRQLAKQSMPRCLQELRKKGIKHAIVTNPQNPKKQKIWYSEKNKAEDLYYIWRNHNKAELIIICTMEECISLRQTKGFWNAK